MKEIRKELMKSKVPKDIFEVVRNLTPPKGIRRKNIEGAELLYLTEEEGNIDDAHE